MKGLTLIEFMRKKILVFFLFVISLSTINIVEAAESEVCGKDVIDKYLDFVKEYANSEIYYSIEDIGENGEPVLLLVSALDNEGYYEKVDNKSIYSSRCEVYSYVNGEIAHLGELMNLMGSLSLYTKEHNYYVATSSNGHSKNYTYVKDNAQYTYGYNTNNLAEDTVRYEEHGEYYDYAYGTTNYDDAIAEYSEIGKIIFERDISDDKNEKTYEINDFIGSYTSDNLSGLLLEINDAGNLDVRTYLVFGNDGIHTPGGEHNVDNTWIVSDYWVQNDTLTIIATDFGNECCLELTLLDENTLLVSCKGDSYSTDNIYNRDYADDIENLREASKVALQRFIDNTETEPIYAVCDLNGDGIDEIIIRTVWHQTADEPYHYLILIAVYNSDSDEYETSHHRKIEMELNDAELHYSKEWNRLIQADSYGNYNALYLQDDWLLSEKVTSDIYDASPEMKYRSGRLYAKYLSFDIEQITQADNYDKSLELLLDSVENGYETEYFPNKYSLCDLNNDEIAEVIIREYSPEYTEGGKFRYSIYEYDATKKCFCLLTGQFISFACDALAYDEITNSLVVNWTFADEPYFCFYGYENGKIVVTMTSEEENSFETLSFYNISDEQMEVNTVDDYQKNNAFYGIWCGASRDYEEAENIAYDIGEQGGLSVDIYYTPEWSNLNREPWYALSAGSYLSEIEAYENLNKVQMIVPDAYIRYSGEFLG